VSRVERDGCPDREYVARGARPDARDRCCFCTRASRRRAHFHVPPLDEVRASRRACRRRLLSPWQSERLARRSTDECSSSQASACGLSPDPPASHAEAEAPLAGSISAVSTVRSLEARSLSSRMGQRRDEFGVWPPGCWGLLIQRAQGAAGGSDGPGYARPSRASTERGSLAPRSSVQDRPAPPRRVAADRRSSRNARRAAPSVPRRRASSCAARPTARAMGFWPHARSRPARPSWSASWSGR
jgi:hypothetical protein